MRLKSKLTAGLIFLFCVILALGLLGIYSIRRLAMDSDAVLRNNENSVAFCSVMLERLEVARSLPAGSPGSSLALSTFDSALVLEEANITETGEGEATAELRKGFDRLRATPGDTALYPRIRRSLYRISELNQDAIQRKSLVAQATAHRAIYGLSVIVGILTLAAFVFVLNFPGAVSRPVQAQNEAKTHFIATISHELKTPLSSIKMVARLLQDERVGNLNDEQRELVVQVTEDANRLLRITGELLNLTQAETGRIQLQISSVPPAEIVDVAMRAVHFQARAKNLQMVSDIQDEDLRVYADAEKSSWVLINYLTNAIRHSLDEGMVTITVHGEADGNVAFVVRDQGPGIEERYLPKLFDKYFRIPGSSDDSGTGLGLAISKEFIEAQGGVVSVWSAPGYGSAFTFTLPSTIKKG